MSVFTTVCTAVLAYPSKPQLPVPTFDRWTAGHVFRLSDNFRQIILPELEAWRPNGTSEVRLTVLELNVSLSFERVWAKLPSSPVPWCVLDLLPSIRDDNTNDALPRHGDPTLFCIPGAYQVDGQGKAFGDPESLPVRMYRDASGLRPVWHLDQWDVLDSGVCPSGTRALVCS